MDFIDYGSQVKCFHMAPLVSDLLHGKKSLEMMDGCRGEANINKPPKIRRIRLPANNTGWVEVIPPTLHLMIANELLGFNVPVLPSNSFRETGRGCGGDSRYGIEARHMEAKQYYKYCGHSVHETFMQRNFYE
jgi:hypothetical protein